MTPTKGLNESPAWFRNASPPRPGPCFRRPSPFTEEGLFGAGFVSDEDRVSLQPLLFATPTSRGGTGEGS